MMPICKYFVNSECTNPRCKFIHPVEYPIYIYTVPGIDIHPDELRWAVICDETMAKEADTVWLNNYKQFCSENVEKSVDLLEEPSYFCMPFDTDFIGAEIEKIKVELKSKRVIYDRRKEDNNYQTRNPRYVDNAQENRPYNQPRGGRDWNNGPRNNSYDNRPPQNFVQQGERKNYWKSGNDEYKSFENRNSCERKGNLGYSGNRNNSYGGHNDFRSSDTRPPHTNKSNSFNNSSSNYRNSYEDKNNEYGANIGHTDNRNHSFSSGTNDYRSRDTRNNFANKNNSFTCSTNDYGSQEGRNYDNKPNGYNYSNRTNSYESKNINVSAESQRTGGTLRNSHDHPNGFERNVVFNAHQNNKDSSEQPSQEYDQYNVPYNYK